jgi:hypothetical protein
MTTPIDADALKTLFTEARTLVAIYDLSRMMED